jgi:hypothetical protein
MRANREEDGMMIDRDQMADEAVSLFQQHMH